MEQLKSIAAKFSRGSREARLVTAAALNPQAASRPQPLEAAFTAGIFPECWKRNFPRPGPQKHPVPWSKLL